MNVYFLSGLGADERAFKRLRLAEQLQIYHVRWPEPEQKETIEQYAAKVAKLIDRSRDFSIVGLSFGGMVMIELLKALNPRHAILISSVGSRQEIPGSMLNKVYPFAHLFTGLQNPDDKALWAEIIRDSDPWFLKWAIHEILNWKNEQRPANIFHIHGSKDRTFPLRLVHPDRIIAGGGHFMVLSHADEISRILNERLIRRQGV